MPDDATTGAQRAHDTTLLRQIYDYDNRANPYPLWQALRAHPVSVQDDDSDSAGRYVVSTYRVIEGLLHDPRLSSDLRKSARGGELTADVGEPYPFILLDPPQHDRLRALTMRHFGPPERPAYLEHLRPEVTGIVRSLLDDLSGQPRFDFVDSFAYQLPVTVICRILGVPLEDEPRFHQWSRMLVQNLAQPSEAARRQREQANNDLHQYIGELIQERRQAASDDLLSRMATDADGMDAPHLVSTATLLLIAGHETTVNLLSNGLLTFLRYPAAMDLVRNDPDLIPNTVEELLRYEPPVQMLPNRTALDEISVDGTVIPKGALVTLALAAGNRDPARFADPDRFDPRRTNIEHLGFGSGIHSCFGAPLARVEAHIAFAELLRRLERPRLVADPPPYRPNPVLRGPEHLWIEVDGISARSAA